MLDIVPGAVNPRHRRGSIHRLCGKCPRLPTGGECCEMHGSMLCAGYTKCASKFYKDALSGRQKGELLRSV